MEESYSAVVYKTVIKIRLCANEVVSERFENSQNENDMNHKNSDRMKFLVFAWFL